MGSKDNVFDRIAQRHHQTKAAAPVAPSDTPTPAAAQKPVGKNKDSNYKKIGAYIHKDIHKRLKIKIAAEDLELSELIENLVKDWLDSE